MPTPLGNILHAAELRPYNKSVFRAFGQSGLCLLVSFQPCLSTALTSIAPCNGHYPQALRRRKSSLLA